MLSFSTTKVSLKSECAQPHTLSSFQNSADANCDADDLQEATERRAFKQAWPYCKSGSLPVALAMHARCIDSGLTDGTEQGPMPANAQVMVLLDIVAGGIPTLSP